MVNMILRADHKVNFFALRVESVWVQSLVRYLPLRLHLLCFFRRNVLRWGHDERLRDNFCLGFGNIGNLILHGFRPKTLCKARFLNFALHFHSHRVLNSAPVRLDESRRVFLVEEDLSFLKRISRLFLSDEALRLGVGGSYLSLALGGVLLCELNQVRIVRVFWNIVKFLVLSALRLAWVRIYD